MKYPIASITELGNGIYSMEILAPDIARAAVPGQFVHIICGGQTLLRRPISICDVVGDKVRVVFQKRGTGTGLLADYKEGDMLDVLGPLGNGFSPEKANGGTAVLIGGGIGVFPLLKLAKSIKGEADIVLGFRTKDLVVMEDEFAKVCDNLHITTDDGSYGIHGFVTDRLKKLIQEKQVSVIYSCGPTPMMKRVAEIAEAAGIPVQVSLEERMGCGVGGCATCTCTVSGSRKRVCKDGPVFNGTEVEWNG